LYEGKFIKGIYFSEAVELINKLFPELSSVFFAFTYSPGISYSWAPIADAYSSLYKNPQREKWFRETYPDRAHKPIIPLQDTDFINEYLISPRNVPEKDIDLLAVARISEEKNLPTIAQALKVYRQKYPHKPIKLTVVTGHDFDVNNMNSLDEFALNEWRQIETILTNPCDYINLVPRVDYFCPRFPPRRKKPRNHRSHELQCSSNLFPRIQPIRQRRLARIPRRCRALRQI